MRVAVGSDHRGIEFKKMVIKILEKLGHTCEDMGTYTEEAVDYPDIALKVAQAILKGDCQRGVLICGTGIGMCMAANKIKGAAQCYDAFTAMRARLHNDAQICCLGAEEGKATAPAVLETFMKTEYEGGRHDARLAKMKHLEES